MAPKSLRSNSKKLTKTNTESIKPEKRKNVWNLSDEYINSSLNQLHFSAFLSERKLKNILEIKKPTSTFADKYMGSKWMESLKRDERKHVMDICDCFLNVFVNAPHWFRYLETLDIDGVVKEILEIGIHFGFGSNLNKLLGIDFSKAQVIDNSIVSFKTVKKIISSVPSCQFEMPNKSGKLTRGPDFFQPLLFKMLNIYVRCLICAIRKLFVCRVKGNHIVKWDSRSERNPLFNIPVTLPTNLPKPDDILIRIWVEEYFVTNGVRIDIRHIARSSGNSSWISRMLEKKPDFKNLFNSTFALFKTYLLCEESKDYFMNILNQTRTNLERLVRSGEFQTIARKIMNGYSGQNNMLNNEKLHEIHGRLGEVMVAIGRKILNFEKYQLLSKEFEIFVRNITYSRTVVLDELNCWDLFESFDKNIEDELTVVLKDSKEFEKSLLLSKMTFSRFVIWVCVQVLRSVVKVNLFDKRMASFEYDGHMEFGEAEHVRPHSEKVKTSHCEITQKLIANKDDMATDDNANKVDKMPENSTSTEKHLLKVLDAAFRNTKKPPLKRLLENNEPYIPEKRLKIVNRSMCENEDLRRDCEEMKIM